MRKIEFEKHTTVNMLRKRGNLQVEKFCLRSPLLCGIWSGAAPLLVFNVVRYSRKICA